MSTRKISMWPRRTADSCVAGDGGLEVRDVAPSLAPKPSTILRFKAKAKLQLVEFFGHEVESIRPNECQQCQGDLDKAGNCSQCGDTQPVQRVARGMSIRDVPDPEFDTF
jgi:hypothetical protein